MRRLCHPLSSKKIESLIFKPQEVLKGGRGIQGGYENLSGNLLDRRYQVTTPGGGVGR